MEGKSTFTVKW